MCHYAKVRQILQEELGEQILPYTPLEKLHKKAQAALQKGGLTPRREAVLRQFLAEPQRHGDADDAWGTFNPTPSTLSADCIPATVGRWVGRGTLA